MFRYLNINILVAVDIVLWTLMHLFLSRRIRTLKSRNAESARTYLE